MPKSLGLAIFTKTASHTPLKTRLTFDIGESESRIFFELSLHCLRQEFGEFVRRAEAGEDRRVYLAHYEEKLDPLIDLAPLQTFWQGEGTFGDRLGSTYSYVLNLNDEAIVISSDSPQIDQRHFEATAEKLKNHDYVIGPALDGGFYLLAGRKVVSKSVFDSIPYSTSNAFESLDTQLKKYGTVAYLDPLTDVDVGSDLHVLYDELRFTETLSPFKQELKSWLQTKLADQPGG